MSKRRCLKDKYSTHVYMTLQEVCEHDTSLNTTVISLIIYTETATCKRKQNILSMLRILSVYFKQCAAKKRTVQTYVSSCRDLCLKLFLNVFSSLFFARNSCFSVVFSCVFMAGRRTVCMYPCSRGKSSE